MKIRRYAQIILISVCVLTICGCASNAGNESIRSESKKSLAKHIRQNVTTKAQIQQAFGKPSSIMFNEDNLEVWTYEFSRNTINPDVFIPVYQLLDASTTTKTKTLVIYFNLDGIVVKYDFNKKKEISSWGLFH